MARLFMQDTRHAAFERMMQQAPNPAAGSAEASSFGPRQPPRYRDTDLDHKPKYRGRKGVPPPDNSRGKSGKKGGA